LFVIPGWRTGISVSPSKWVWEAKKAWRDRFHTVCVCSCVASQKQFMSWNMRSTLFWKKTQNFSAQISPRRKRSRQAQASGAGPSDALQACTCARPQTVNCNSFVLNDFEIGNADACAEPMSNKSKQDPREEMPRLLPLKSFAFEQQLASATCLQTTCLQTTCLQTTCLWTLICLCNFPLKTTCLVSCVHCPFWICL
jgi:hypothetical protein